MSELKLFVDDDAHWRDTAFRLDQLTRAIAELRTFMSQAIVDLTREVSETKDTVDSAITLLNGLSAQIMTLKDDPVALAALATELDATSNKLAAAVVANTPAEAPAEAQARKRT